MYGVFVRSTVLYSMLYAKCTEHAPNVFECVWSTCTYRVHLVQLGYRISDGIIQGYRCEMNYRTPAEVTVLHTPGIPVPCTEYGVYDSILIPLPTNATPSRIQTSVAYTCQVGIPLHIYIRATYWSCSSFQRQGRTSCIGIFLQSTKLRMYLFMCVAAGTRQGMDGLGVVPGIVGWSWLMCDVKALDDRVAVYVTRGTLYFADYVWMTWAVCTV